MGLGQSFQLQHCRNSAAFHRQGLCDVSGGLVSSRTEALLSTLWILKRMYFKTEEKGGGRRNVDRGYREQKDRVRIYGSV